MRNEIREKEITFYLNEENKTEENPKGVIAASFVDEWGDLIQYCTADVRVRDGFILIGFSSGDKNENLLSSLDRCVKLSIYQEVVYDLKCEIARGFPHFLIIDKTDIDLWQK